MSEQPPPPPPYAMPYQTPSPSFYQPNPRPVSVTVLSILAIIFGGMGALSGWVNLLPYVGGPMKSEVTEAFRNDAVLFPWIVFSLIFGWLLSIVMLMAGIQCLRLRPIGRTLMKAYAWFTLAMVIPGTVVNAAYMMPLLSDLQAKHANNPTVRAAAIGGRIGAVIGLVMGIGIAAYILFVMSRPDVKAAFGVQQAAAGRL